MDRATAKARLTNLVASASRPVLSDPDLESLLNLHQVPDRDGLTPLDVGWTPTWDFNAAAAEGWGWKAGKVAGDFNFTADGASYSKADVLTHCVDRQAHFAARVAGVTRYGPGVRDYIAPDLIP